MKIHRIHRETFLADLQAVRAGLSPREFIEQSSCFVFQGDEVMTFNDEIACRKKIGIELQGAVQADPLLALLEKLSEPELDVSVDDKKNEIEFRGKRKQFGITKDAEIFLPIDRVERPKEWIDIPNGFNTAIEMVRHCVSSDETKFLLTCVHIHPDYIESCDNRQLFRYWLKTGVSEPIQVRGSALNQITDLGMAKLSITKSWVHFANDKDLVFSCRKYVEDYPGLDEIIRFKGEAIKIPKGMEEVTDRANVFAEQQQGDPILMVSLAPGVLRVRSEGLTGWYREVRKSSYEGKKIKFSISPSVLTYVSKNYNRAEISTTKLKASEGNKWVYVTSLGRPTKVEEAAQTEGE